MIMSVAKKIGLTTCLRVCTTSLSSSARPGSASRRRISASVTTIAPSTMAPKSIAPGARGFGGRRVKMCWQLGEVHENEGDDKRQRDRHGHDQRTTRAAEEEDQHDEHEPDALEQHMRDLAHGSVDKVVAIDIGNDADALRRQLSVEPLVLGVNALEHLVGVLGFQQLEDAFDRGGGGCLAENTVARRVA